jgi:hypothetical protein
MDYICKYAIIYFNILFNTKYTSNERISKNSEKLHLLKRNSMDWKKILNSSYTIRCRIKVYENLVNILFVDIYFFIIENRIKSLNKKKIIGFRGGAQRLFCKYPTTNKNLENQRSSSDKPLYHLFFNDIKDNLEYTS